MVKILALVLCLFTVTLRAYEKPEFKFHGGNQPIVTQTGLMFAF
jgi:hypothetical protein